MTAWDPFARVRRRVPQEQTKRQGIGGAADGQAGGLGLPRRRSMNERIRDAHDEMKQKRG
jgi:hypothetical protein